MNVLECWNVFWSDCVSANKHKRFAFLGAASPDKQRLLNALTCKHQDNGTGRGICCIDVPEPAANQPNLLHECLQEYELFSVSAIVLVQEGLVQPIHTDMLRVLHLNGLRVAAVLVKPSDVKRNEQTKQALRRTVHSSMEVFVISTKDLYRIFAGFPQECRHEEAEFIEWLVDTNSVGGMMYSSGTIAAQRAGGSPVVRKDRGEGVIARDVEEIVDEDQLVVKLKAQRRNLRNIREYSGVQYGSGSSTVASPASNHHVTKLHGISYDHQSVEEEDLVTPKIRSKSSFLSGKRSPILVPDPLPTSSPVSERQYGSEISEWQREFNLTAVQRTKRLDKERKNHLLMSGIDSQATPLSGYSETAHDVSCLKPQYSRIASFRDGGGGGVTKAPRGTIVSHQASYGDTSSRSATFGLHSPSNGMRSSRLHASKRRSLSLSRQSEGSSQSSRQTLRGGTSRGNPLTPSGNDSTSSGGFRAKLKHMLRRRSVRNRETGESFEQF